ncbi:MAG: S8 family serine peptidase [Candidatus Eremiobacteraeota bacterium]|nr:S8 family serine peptidase [Candidatus Eremiobacteraeota bacterium]
MLPISTFGPTARPTDRYTPVPRSAEEPSPELLDRVELTANRAQQIESGLGERIPGELLVKVPANLTQEQLKEFAAEHGATLKKDIPIPASMQEAFNGKLLLLEAGHGLSEAQTMALMEADSRVLSMGTNDQMHLISSMKSAELDNQEQPPQAPDEKLPNDVHPEQWNIRNRNIPGGVDGADIQAGKAWAITTGKGAAEGGPIVAVLDSGIDAFHEDLKANMWKNPDEERNGKDDDFDGFTDDVNGINAVDGTGNIFDEIGHGTHVAGVIGAVSDNGKGVAGINWNAQLMGIKIAETERVSLLGAITGVLYAAENGARIANHSWGGPIDNPILKDVMAKSPILHVCAAGNRQQDSDVNPSYPAAYDMPNIISVGASTRKDERLFFSNWGKESVDIFAPGAMVYSTLPVHKYEEMSGTSMATPHVSGVAALIASKYPEASNQEIKDRIIYSADQIDDMRDKSVSGGRLNAFRALEDDKVAPSPVTDLKMTQLTADGFALSWTGVGDDGLEGKLSAYDVWADVGGRRERLVPEFPSEAGSTETVSFRTTPISDERPLKITLTPVDNVGNRPASAVLESRMPAAAVPFADNFDAAESGWTTEAEWGRVEEKGRGMVFTDSPDGEYKDGVDNGIVSPKFDLSEMRSATLSFDAKLKAEQWDFLWVEATSNGGEDYEHLQVVRPSENRDWASYKMDLSAFDGQKNVQLRFRFRTSNKGVDDGVYLDNVKVESAKV